MPLWQVYACTCVCVCGNRGRGVMQSSSGSMACLTLTAVCLSGGLGSAAPRCLICSADLSPSICGVCLFPPSVVFPLPSSPHLQHHPPSYSPLARPPLPPHLHSPPGNALLVKGAAECVLERCDRQMLPDGRIVPLTPAARAAATAALEDMAGGALRTLAIARKCVCPEQLQRTHHTRQA